MQALLTASVFACRLRRDKPSPQDGQTAHRQEAKRRRPALHSTRTLIGPDHLFLPFD